MNKIFRIDSADPSADIINLAASRLRQGAVIVFPTETVYGLGAVVDKDVRAGSEELFDIKQRPTGIPVPVLVPEEDALDKYGVEVPEYAHKLAQEFWPGPLTLVVKANERIPKEFTRIEDGTVGLRFPDNEIALQLMRATGCPLYATSANTHGMPAPVSIDELEPAIAEAADLVIDAGPTPIRVHSTVVLCTGDTPTVLREGPISAVEIEEAAL
ncbi:MAG: L-threonylcarbamoyladenylate synthase [Coriobacteriia bacterium]|nr:L-threonylcarbamoyladenylate synthase [Coriobacteriia bacterium]